MTRDKDNLDAADTLEATLRFLIKEGEKDLPLWEFKERPYIMVRQVSFILSVAFLVSLMIPIPKAYPNGTWSAHEFRMQWYQQGLPASAPLAIAFWGAVVYTQFRERKETAFRLVQELNSFEFEKTRFLLLKLVENRNNPKEDVRSLDGWFPSFGFRLKHSDLQQFSEDHALARVVYFAFRVYLYDHHRMVDRSIMRHMFHNFFAHYQIFFLEFAAALRSKRRSYPDMYDARWEYLADGLQEFLKILGLAGELPSWHRYYFFPTYDPSQVANKKS